LSDENGADDLDVNVTIKATEDDAHKLKMLMIKQGTPQIRAQLAKYIKELKEEFSRGLILPTADKSNNQSGPINAGGQGSKPKPSTEISLNKEATQNAKNLKPSSSGPVKINTKSMTLKESFKCTGEDLYNVFTRVEMMQAFSRSQCESDAKPGGQFSLYSGLVQGKYQEMVPDKKLVMHWRMKGWPDAHYSNVTLTFDQKEDCTELELRQTGIPESQLEQTEGGWKRHYFEAIKLTFGFGARLL
jgi:activator of HSP90 ATPase